MRAPIFVRTISEQEHQRLEAGLRSSDAFVLRRCQILLASERGEHASTIARNLSTNDETVRQVIKKFNRQGLKVLEAGSRRPHHTSAAFRADQADQIKELLHKSPRAYGKDSSVWTLELVAEVSFAEGLTKNRVSDETVRATLERLGIRWKRAKRWITSPDPEYQRKKSSGND
jgi:transposase